MRQIVILGKSLYGGKGTIWGALEATKYKATVCKRNQVDTALRYGMAHSVTGRRTDIIVAIACTAKNLKLHMPFTLQH